MFFIFDNQGNIMIYKMVFVALSFSLTIFPSFASPILPTVSGSPSSIVSLQLQESDPITVSGISLSVNYDRNLFRLDEVTAGDDLISINPIIFFASDPSSVDMVFVALSDDLIISGNTNLLNFIFSISPLAQAGSYSIEFDCAFGNGNCAPDYGSSFSGQIVVESSPSSSVPEPGILAILMMGLFLRFLKTSGCRLIKKA
jgi:hypothetical protein